MDNPEEKYEIEICQWCGEAILEANHDCRGELEEHNYSDRLQRGFEIIDPDDDRG